MRLHVQEVEGSPGRPPGAAVLDYCTELSIQCDTVLFKRCSDIDQKGAQKEPYM